MLTFSTNSLSIKGFVVATKRRFFTIVQNEALFLGFFGNKKKLSPHAG